MEKAGGVSTINQIIEQVTFKIDGSQYCILIFSCGIRDNVGIIWKLSLSVGKVKGSLLALVTGRMHLSVTYHFS